METMKAVRIHSYGGPEVLVYEDAPRPQPEPNDVLVRVHAAGINPVDWKIREGYGKDRLGHRLPLILGWDRLRRGRGGRARRQAAEGGR